jgi:tripartite-type tricarboxylate transporter receptor subunit TctC
MFNPVQEFIEHIKAGRLRSLAVTTETRQAVLPDIPTVGEFVAGYAASGWAGIGAPRNTPVEIIERLNGAMNAGFADPRIVGRLVDSGVAPMSMTPSEFEKFVVEETEKWARVIKFAGIKAE